MSSNPVSRTLYLDGAGQIRVLQDGPALRVRMRGSADRLFPLRGLFQVVVCGSVEWATGALLACAEAAIPVVFLRANGTLRGRVLGLPEHDPLLDVNQLLDILLTQTCGPDRLRDWFDAKSQQARLALVRSSAWQTPSTDRIIIKQVIMRRARLHVRAQDLRRFDRQLYGLLLARITTLLQNAGIDLSRCCLRANRICLEQNFANVLIWPPQDHKLRYMKRLHTREMRRTGGKTTLSWHHTVDFFESKSRTITDEFEHLLKEWHLFILERNNDYAN